jgi:AraC-like DNA-binding protein
MADICQTLAGRAVNWSEPPAADDFERLFADVPSPAIEAERRTIDSTLHAFTSRLAHTVHTNFHQRFRRSGVCQFRVQSFAMDRDSTDGSILVHQSLATWARMLRADFESAHDSAAQRARRSLEASSGPAAIGEVAKRLGIGRRTLERRFRAEVGVSVAEYRTRVRLATLLSDIGSRSGCVEGAALRAGWTTKKGGYDSLRQRTGLTPSRIRALSQAELDGVIASLLICGRTGNRGVTCTRFDCVCCPRRHGRGDCHAHLRSVEHGLAFSATA